MFRFRCRFRNDSYHIYQVLELFAFRAVNSKLNAHHKLLVNLVPIFLVSLEHKLNCVYTQCSQYHFNGKLYCHYHYTRVGCQCHYTRVGNQCHYILVGNQCHYKLVGNQCH